MDIDNDGVSEWGGRRRIGSWGSQDVLLNELILRLGLNPTTWHSILIPREAKSFGYQSQKLDIGLGVQLQLGLAILW